MSLVTYRKKRIFSNTPEPMGGSADQEALRFVIQKHDASHLHYDFRLELDGVLKSWAVPKGPSTDPEIKRLAMMVEDHPYDYRNFEGIIPKGQYGGGTVIVWDEGTYTPAEGKSGNKKEMERNLLRQLAGGKLIFTLSGNKLKGNYALVKSSYQGENSWLLMKMKDKYAKKTDITKKDKSVMSGKSIKQMEKEPEKIYGKTRDTGKRTPGVKTKPVKKIPENPTGKKQKFPAFIEPMLATLIDKPFDEDGWLYEIKWDGYRTLAYLHAGKTELKSRNNKVFDDKFYPIHDALKKLDLDAVLDGEIIVADQEGISNFGNLQNWRSEADGDLIFYVFDILWLNGYSLLGLPLTERRNKLTGTLPDNDLIKVSETFDSTASEFFEAAEKMKLEGIVAKKADSLYSPGVRSREWLKIKTSLRHEVVIGGYTNNEGSNKLFSALLVGVNKNGKLTYSGKIGTGFSDRQQKVMIKKFKPLIRKQNPFEKEPDINKPSRFRPHPPKATVTWLKPEIVCEVSYTEVTSDGVMRHPSFEGLRIDKEAAQVKEEKAVEVKSTKHKSNSVLHKKQLLTKAGKGERKTLLNPSEVQQERKINGHILKFTNLNKLYWPKEKISKRDMLNYYFQVAPYMLPYLKDRPQSLNRHPNGINGMSFYQKDVTGKVPEWIKTFPYRTEGVKKNFMVCTREEDILYMASLGCIEINPWSSRIDSPENPDWCIIDLDPDKNKFDQVIETANVTRQILESAGVTGYCKTSGSTGLHIYIPLGAKYTYESSKEFGRLIAALVNEQLPSFTSIERATSNRKGRIYIDFLQNRPQATLAAPYSLRPKPGATVSMPLAWDEVKKGLTMQDFTIHNAVARIREQGDLFKPVLGKGIDIKKAITKLEKL
ncbi:MAG: ATP-dependent ligase clustered with Ku protein LigD [Chitinophagaceae bacterium]|nr:ATP-dependent ligase clustered with Ku protein LigD [Chitinophagaceae bacterium]